MNQTIGIKHKNTIWNAIFSQ